MTQNEILENAVYGVMLTSGQAVNIAEVNPGEKVFDCARRNIGCDWIEIVEPNVLRDHNYLSAEYSEILSQKQKDYALYWESRAQMRELLTVKANIDTVTEKTPMTAHLREKEITR